MELIQLVLTAFLLFALSRVFLRFRDKKVSGGEFVFWTGLFLSAIVGVAFPDETSRVASLMGIGRGVDLIVYASIAALFYLVFRAYVLMEDIRHEITELVRKIAIENYKKK